MARSRMLSLVLTALLLPSSSGAQAAPPAADRRATQEPRGRPSLIAFRSDREIVQFLSDLEQPDPADLAKLRAARESEAHEMALRLRAGVIGGDSPSGEACRVAAPPIRELRTRDAAVVDAPTITGRVTNSAGQPLFGANVSIEAWAISVGTGEDGRYVIAVPAGRIPTTGVILRVRAFGYIPRVHAVAFATGDFVIVDVAMCQDVNRLSQVTVTGAGAAERSPGSIAAPARAPAFSPAALPSVAADATITNTQHADVDEGGIVKVHGDHLVVLRRGRLFTVAIGKESLDPVASVDAFAPGMDPRGAWYDEMLIHDDKVIVIGYSYRRDGTELNLFRIDRGGRLRHLSSYHLRSGDYYSERNYASRLVDGRLVFYAASAIKRGDTDPLSALPSLRRWDGRSSRDGFRRIVAPTRVFRADRDLRGEGTLLFHAMTSCGFTGDALDCESSVVIAPEGEESYVSPSAVYVWTAPTPKMRLATRQSALVYRLPLDGSLPQAIGTRGMPIDQFSFRERDGALHVLVDEAQPPPTDGNVNPLGLLHISLASFADGSGNLPDSSYRWLPSLVDPDFRTRFIGDHLLYGTRASGRRSQRSQANVVVVDLRGRGVTSLTLRHRVDRIESLGANAVVIGSDGAALRLTGVSLGERPRSVQHLTIEGAAEGEQRSHGFSYREDSAVQGVLGFPVRTVGGRLPSARAGVSEAVVLIRNTGPFFKQLGYLAADAEAERDDRCRASCVDWYGNARAIFLRGRLFALLGYEIVEGVETNLGVHEVRRVDLLRD